MGQAGLAARLLHRIAGVVFILCPLIYLIGDPKGFFYSLKEALLWSKDDFVWLVKAWRYYTYTTEEKVPPQGKYNAGQKINVLTQIVAFVLFTVTGLGMWLGQGSVTPANFLLMVVLHDLSAIAVVILFMIHLYLVAIHPFTRESITAMFEGVVTREYAEEHHAKWYKKIKALVIFQN
jgi:formate dehydrogenase subunit gamma